jgi:hypothetical protein
MGILDPSSGSITVHQDISAVYQRILICSTILSASLVDYSHIRNEMVIMSDKLGML